jgi:two-component sensor histidine kinase/HAMP domain-containing protein
VKLRNQILLALLILSLPLVAINAWWIAAQQEREQQRALDRLRHQAQEAAGMVEVFLTDLGDRGQQTALLLPAASQRQAFLRDRLAYLRFWNPGITGIAWMDTSGEVLAGEPAALFPPGARFVGREVVHALGAARGWALDELLIAVDGERPQGILRLVARQGAAATAGIVGIRLAPDAFGPLFPPDTHWAHIRLADQAGRLVYATDRPMPTLDERYAWVETPGLRAALRGGAPTTQVGTIPGDPQGRRWMAAHAPIPGTGWVVSALIPEPEAMGEARRSLYGTLLIQGLLMALCTGGALALAHRVAAPARRLAEAAQRIALGDRTVRLRLGGQSEMAAVGRAFDEMAESLDVSWRALRTERDVAEAMAARLASLSRLASLVSSTLDQSRVFDFIAEATSHLLDGAVVLLLVTDPEDGSLSLRASHGVSHPGLRIKNRYCAGEGLIGWVFEQREPLVLTDMLADPRTLNRAWAEAERLHAFAAVPLMLPDRCLGVLYAARGGERPFAAQDVDLLQSFAAHASAAIQNAQRYEQSAREARLKGLLLDELNHRVRNNLALIVSFMELQRATPAGRRAATFLDEVIGRVKGLAVVHDVLGGAGFQAGQYEALLHRLAEQTLLQGPLEGRVAFVVEAQPLRLPSKALTALGIITNELFTNIAKHAFPDGRRGTVEVVVRPDGPEVEIRIRDDGVPPPARTEASGQLGLRLIRSLVEVSLQGRFRLEADERTTAIIRFPRPEDGSPGAEPPPEGPSGEDVSVSGQQTDD